MDTKNIAVFLIALVLTIPFITASAFASFLSVKASGADMVDGFRKGQDITLIRATAQIGSNVTVDPSQVIRTDDEDTPFESCDELGNDKYLCFLSYVRTSITNGFPINVKLVDSNGNTLKTASTTLQVDNTTPMANSISTDKTTYGLENVSISYSVSDPGTCSGIGSVTIFSNGNPVLTNQLNSTNCQVTSSLFVMSTQLRGSSGDDEICIQPTDRLGLVGDKKCTTVSMSYEAGDISDVHVEKDGKWVYYSNGALTGDLVINISKEGSVLAELSALTNSNGWITGSCSSGQCRWANLPLIINTSKQYLEFNVTDNLGNNANYQIGSPVRLDNVAPVVTNVYGLNPDDDPGYLGKMNNITADVFEQTSGVDQLLLTGGSLSKFSDYCTGSKCYWENVSLTTPGNITLSVFGKDKAGNVGPSFKKHFVIDLNPPVLVSIKNESSTGYCPTYNDVLTITAEVTDDTTPSIWANASAIANSDVYTGTCEQGSNETDWLCSVALNDLKVTSASGKVYVYISDKPGNSITVPLDTNVCALETSKAPPSVGLTDIKIIPTEIDRRVASTSGQLLFVSFKYDLGTSQSVVSQSADCSGMSDFIQPGVSPYFIGLNTLVVPIGSDSATLSNATDFKLNCSLRLIVKSGSTIYNTPRIVTLTKQIDLVNTPIGEMADEVQSKIDQLDKQINDTQKDYEGKEKNYKVVADLCSLIEKIGTINNALQFAGSVLVGVGCGLSLIPFGIGKAIDGALGGVAKGIRNIDYNIVNYLWNPSFFPAPSPTGIVVYQFCSIVACRLCDQAYWGQGVNTLINPIIGPMPLTVTNTLTKNQGHTTLPTAGRNWVIDPFKSKAAAQACLCYPGIIYNLKKERQLQCLQKSCYQQLGENGMPIGTCDDVSSVRYCLYTQGGNDIGITDILFKYFPQAVEKALFTWKNLVSFHCYSTIPLQKTDGETLCSKTCCLCANAICSLSRSTIGMDMSKIFNNTFSKLMDQQGVYEAKMTTDYCGDGAAGQESLVKFSDPIIPEWQAVSNDDIETCTKWGGTKESYNLDAGQTYANYAGDIIATIQATKTKGVNQTLYEVGYFIDASQPWNYSVAVRGDDFEYLVTKTETTESVAGYKAFYDNDTRWTTAELKVNTTTIKVNFTER